MTFDEPGPWREHVHSAPPAGQLAEATSPLVHFPVQAHDPSLPPLHAPV